MGAAGDRTTHDHQACSVVFTLRGGYQQPPTQDPPLPYPPPTITQVGSVTKRGISGGQRKRVNIGMELVSRPSVCFMDEPTSGLDSSATLEVLAALKKWVWGSVGGAWFGA